MKSQVNIVRFSHQLLSKHSSPSGSRLQGQQFSEVSQSIDVMYGVS
jgi:hypothetical protein